MKLFRYLTLFVLCLGPLASARAQGIGDSPEQQVVSFYTWYLHGLNAGGNPPMDKKVEMKKYVSARFIKEIDRLSRIEGGIEADPFLCAQDWDKDWEKHIHTLGLRAKDGTAEGNVVLEGKEMGRYELMVQLVREGGAWKIDRVKHQEKTGR